MSSLFNVDLPLLSRSYSSAIGSGRWRHGPLSLSFDNRLRGRVVTRDTLTMFEATVCGRS